jgi:hypothetical protein
MKDIPYERGTGPIGSSRSPTLAGYDPMLEIYP